MISHVFWAFLAFYRPEGPIGAANGVTVLIKLRSPLAAACKINPKDRRAFDALAADGRISYFHSRKNTPSEILDCLFLCLSNVDNARPKSARLPGHKRIRTKWQFPFPKWWHSGLRDREGGVKRHQTYLEIVSWSMSVVLQFHLEAPTSLHLLQLSFLRQNPNIGAQLLERNRSGVLKRLLALADGTSNVVDADSRDDGLQGRDEDHPKGEGSRGLLGREIALLVILATLGLWVANRSFDKAGETRSVDAGLLWMIPMLSGSGFAAYSLLVLVIHLSG